MDIQKFDVSITRHAFLRAIERKVTPDMVEATIKGGTQRVFGKAFISLSKQYKHFTVVCIGEIVGNTIIIKTVETKQ